MSEMASAIVVAMAKLVIAVILSGLIILNNYYIPLKALKILDN